MNSSPATLHGKLITPVLAPPLFSPFNLHSATSAQPYRVPKLQITRRKGVGVPGASDTETGQGEAGRAECPTACPAHPSPLCAHVQPQTGTPRPSPLAPRPSGWGEPEHRLWKWCLNCSITPDTRALGDTGKEDAKASSRPEPSSIRGQEAEKEAPADPSSGHSFQSITPCR